MDAPKKLIWAFSNTRVRFNLLEPYQVKQVIYFGVQTNVKSLRDGIYFITERWISFLFFSHDSGMGIAV